MELFRTETIKRTSEASYSAKIFFSEELPKNLIKEGSLKFRLFHDERYANDICFGELIIPLKRLQSIPNVHSFMSIDDETIELDNNSQNNTVPSMENFDPIQHNNHHQMVNNQDNQFKTSVYTMFPIKEVRFS